MSTGENEQDMRKILDMTRLLSIAMLLIHFYYYCYGGFVSRKIRSNITDQVMVNLVRTGLFNSVYFSKSIALGLLVISLLGAHGKKEDEQKISYVLLSLLSGIILFYASSFVLNWQFAVEKVTVIYIGITVTGYCLILSGGTRATRIIVAQLRHDIFNEVNETFPQEERLIINEFSVNFNTEYLLKNRVRQSHINIINPFRGTLVTLSLIHISEPTRPY